jgi:mercuric ion binding protein
MIRILILFLLLISSIYARDVVIEVKGMHCPLCTTMVKKALKKVDGVTKAKAILQDKRAYVTVNESVTDKMLLDAVKTTSYDGIIVKE